MSEPDGLARVSRRFLEIERIEVTKRTLTSRTRVAWAAWVKIVTLNPIGLLTSPRLWPEDPLVMNPSINVSYGEEAVGSLRILLPEARSLPRRGAGGSPKTSMTFRGPLTPVRLRRRNRLGKFYLTPRGRREDRTSPTPAAQADLIFYSVCL